MPAHRSPTESAYQRQVLRAHENLQALAGAPPDEDGSGQLGVRDAVVDSWRRSLAHLPTQREADIRIAYESSALEDARRGHVFHDVLPLLRSRLIEPATDAGLIVALGDAQGKLLWVEGDSSARSRAESMGFVSGADWSEDVMGTSAPALALAANKPMQVVGAEHFVEAVHPWSCSAVPLLHPFSGETLGIIDITGGTEAVSPLVVPLLTSTAHAVQDELRERLRPDPSSRGTSAATAGTPWLHLTGCRVPTIDFPGGRLDLTTRHAELLTLLHLATGGITGAELAEQLHARPDSEGTVRAELVRLRKILADTAGGDSSLALASRPYRLTTTVDSDLRRVYEALARGDVQATLEHYHGDLVPASEAPGILQRREELRSYVRQVVLDHGSWDQVWRYSQLPEAAEDTHVLMTVLQLAPPDAPERAAALVRLESADDAA